MPRLHRVGAGRSEAVTRLRFTHSMRHCVLRFPLLQAQTNEGRPFPASRKALNERCGMFFSKTVLASPSAVAFASASRPASWRQMRRQRRKGRPPLSSRAEVFPLIVCFRYHWFEGFAQKKRKFNVCSTEFASAACELWESVLENLQSRRLMCRRKGNSVSVVRRTLGAGLPQLRDDCQFRETCGQA